MPLFSKALDRFRESGCFELQNTIVSFKQLDRLLESFVSSAQAPYPKFQLRDVTIVPFHQEELIDQSAPRNTALTGSLRKEELPALLRDRAESLYSVDYKYDKALLFLSYMDISIEREIESEQIKAISEKILINLFKQTTCANLLESLPDEPSLVGRIFAAKEEKVYKKIILDHVKKDLSIFVPFIARLLPSYKKIDDGLRDIKLQLDKFVTILLEQDQLPFLFKLFMGIGLEAKKENWEKDFRLIVTAAQVGTHKDPVTHSSLSNFEKMIEILYGEVEQAKNQWFRGYQFNCKLLESLKQLLESIKVYKNHLFIEWENGQAGGSLEQANIELQQKLNKAEEKIEKMEMRYAQDYADQEARFEAKFTDQEARFEAKLSKLFPHATQQEAGASESYSHISKNSNHFFTRPSY